MKEKNNCKKDEQFYAVFSFKYWCANYKLLKITIKVIKQIHTIKDILWFIYNKNLYLTNNYNYWFA